MSVENEGEVVETTETSVQSAYDRIANPDKVQVQEEIQPAEPTVETPPEMVSMDEIRELKSQVSRIPELEKRLRDDGGRYGALKQSLEQIQQRIADRKEASGGDVDVEEALADIKEHFGEDELYSGLKSALSKLGKGQAAIDPDAIEKIVASKISEAKQAERQEAVDRLTEERPTWRDDVATSEFSEWKQSLPQKERDRLDRSVDPDYVAGRLHEFDVWKVKKTTPKEETKPEPKGPSKRLAAAVLPTNGAKPKAVGDDSKSQVRAAYERVAGNRR